MAESRRIHWRCDVCGELIADGQGRLYVNENDVKEVQRAHSDFDRETLHPSARVHVYTAADLARLPLPARWEFRHDGCDPAPARGDYWIEIDAVRTESALLVKTAHLMGKAWLDATNWDEVIAGVGEGSIGRDG